MDKSRKFSLDLLRIIAIFCVVTMAVSERYILMSGVNDENFLVANAFSSISRMGVPLFVMISGALFLCGDKEIDMKRLWLHNILRLFVVFLLWSCGYYIFQSLYKWRLDLWHQTGLRTANGIAYSADHLWFLGVLIGLYALTPVLATWLKKAGKQNVEYFLFLFLVFGIFRTTIVQLLDKSLVYRFSDLFNVVELSGYLGYFVLGYYLMAFPIQRRMRIAIYSSLPACVVINYMVSWKLSERDGMFNPGIYDSFGIFTFIEVMAVFVAVTAAFGPKKEIKPFVSKLVKNISLDSFGIYLVHLMIIDVMTSEGVFFVATPALLWEIPMVLSVMIVSMIIAAILRRIPYVGRFIC